METQSSHFQPGLKPGLGVREAGICTGGVETRRRSMKQREAIGSFLVQGVSTSQEHSKFPGAGTKLKTSDTQNTCKGWEGKSKEK